MVKYGGNRGYFEETFQTTRGVVKDNVRILSVPPREEDSRARLKSTRRALSFWERALIKISKSAIVLGALFQRALFPRERSWLKNAESRAPRSWEQ